MHRPTLALLAVVLANPGPADDRDGLKVGPQPDGRIVTPTNQILTPAGKQVLFPGRPVDLLLFDGRLIAKNMRDLTVIDPATGEVVQTLPLPAGAFSAVGLARVGDRVVATDTANQLRIARRGADGQLAWADPVKLPAPAVGGAAYPTGVAAAGPDRAWVCSSRGNELVLLDLATGKADARVPVGVAPYLPVVVGDKVYVSNWGGDQVPKADATHTTSGTPVRTDPRTSVANTGTVSVVEKVNDTWKQTKSVSVGGHPCGMAAAGRFLYVTNANSDTVSVIDTTADTVVETIDVKPEGRLPFGSGANAVAVAPDGKRLYVANGTNNCVAVVKLGSPSRVAGLIPTGWYPGAVLLDGGRLFVANVKGHGALRPRKPVGKSTDGDDPPAARQPGKNSHDHLGTVSLIDLPDAAGLAKFTAAVNANNRLGYSLAGLEKPRPGVKPVPVPERHGEPSVFDHVIYVIKENRTYDQVLGDVKEGNGDPGLCIFGADVTPNHHKLAREFVLLDNFYCSGVLSADGHSWVNEAYVTDYLEKQFGQFVRSYPYEGSDPLAFPTSGFLWDNALARGKTFTNYGEFCKTTFAPRTATWADLYADYRDGTSKVAVTVRPNLKSLEPHTHPHFPGFPLTAPDVWRAKLFVEELAKWEKKGTFPNLVYVFLPGDHTNGTRPGSPTPRAMVADNDLALGRVVEAVSRSKFWPKTCILVTEDDPQNGFDHVDGHRTVGMAISPYTRRGAVDSTCYNQTGMVKTIELMLGLPPMTQMDLAATPMRGCFRAAPDLTPYTAAKNVVPLDEMNKPLAKLSGRERYWAEKSVALAFEKEDEADEDTLNRILWHAVRGDATYPGDR